MDLYYCPKEDRFVDDPYFYSQYKNYNKVQCSNTKDFINVIHNIDTEDEVIYFLEVNCISIIEILNLIK